MTAQVQVGIKTPSVPRYLWLENAVWGIVAVEDLTDDELRAVARQWEAALLEVAQMRRNRKFNASEAAG